MTPGGAAFVFQSLIDELANSAYLLRGTALSHEFPGVLGDDMLCCSLSLAGSRYIPALAEKRDALIAQGQELLAKFAVIIADGQRLVVASWSGPAHEVGNIRFVTVNGQILCVGRKSEIVQAARAYLAAKGSA